MEGKRKNRSPSQFPAVSVDGAVDDISMAMLQQGIRLRLPGFASSTNYAFVHLLFFDELGRGRVVRTTWQANVDSSAFLTAEELTQFSPGMRVIATGELPVPGQDGLFQRTGSTTYTIVV